MKKEETKQTDWKDSTKAIMESYGDNPKDFLYEEPKCLYDTPKSCENSECRVLNKCNGDRVRPKQETLEEAEKNIGREEWINFFKNNSKEEILEYLINYKFPL